MLNIVFIIPIFFWTFAKKSFVVNRLSSASFNILPNGVWVAPTQLRNGLADALLPANLI